MKAEHPRGMPTLLSSLLVLICGAALLALVDCHHTNEKVHAGSKQLLLHKETFIDAFWLVDVAANRLTVKVRTNAKGWFAIGFSNSSRPMAGTDVVAFGTEEVDDVELALSDRYATHSERPDKDVDQDDGPGTDDYRTTVPLARRADGVLLVTFERDLRTPDAAHDFQFDLSIDQELKMVGAYHASEKLFGSEHSKAKRNTIRFLSTNELAADPDRLVAAGGDDDDEDDAKAEGESGRASGGRSVFEAHVAHGTIMLLAWLLAAPAAIFYSRYLKPIGEQWFRMHVALSASLAIGAISGFVVIALHVSREQEPHFASVHARTGLAVLVFMLAQALLGYVSHLRFNPARPHAPIFPDRVHWYVGRLLLLLAFGTALMGVELAGGGLGFRQWPSALLLIGVMLACALFVAAESRYLTGRRRGEEERALAKTLQRWLLLWCVPVVALIFTIAGLLE